MWWVLLVGIGAAAFVFLAVIFLFQTARELSKIDIEKRDQQIAALKGKIQQQEGEKQQLANQTKAAMDQVEEWKRKYELGVPNGVSKTLFDQMQVQLQKGVPPERMALFIDQAAKPRSCDPEPESVQLYVRTGIGKPGGKFETTFGGHRLNVTLNGDPAVNADGQKEAWFDTEKAISVMFTDPLGQHSELSGILPLKHQMVIGDSEFQIAIAVEEKRRGYALVTAARCNFP
jgi:hypothetical protein